MTTRTKWLFVPSEADERMVENERQRLEEKNPGVTITRADAMRSMFVRASAMSTDSGVKEIESEEPSGLGLNQSAAGGGGEHVAGKGDLT